VCLDVPKRGPVPVCANGHVVCSKCLRLECPTCRSLILRGFIARPGWEGINRSVDPDPDPELSKWPPEKKYSNKFHAMRAKSYLGGSVAEQ
jgi:hypothetical protein